MKTQTIKQLVALLIVMGAVGCGSEGDNKIVTPSGQTISASSNTPAPQGTSGNVAAPTANKPPSQTSTGGSSAPVTSIQNKPTSLEVSGSATQASALPGNAALVAFMEFSGGFLNHNANPSMDGFDSPDGSYTILLSGTDEAGDGQYSYTAKFTTIQSPDGKTITQKPIETHIELKSFKFQSKCLGEVVLSGKVDAAGWQVDYKDTLLTDLEYFYSTKSNANGAVSIVIAGTPHIFALNNVKVSAKNKELLNMSKMEFGPGALFDGKAQDMNSQLQATIDENCFYSGGQL